MSTCARACVHVYVNVYCKPGGVEFRSSAALRSEDSWVKQTNRTRIHDGCASRQKNVIHELLQHLSCERTTLCTQWEDTAIHT